jgi:hydroxyacylglutathione hydrolase
MLPEIKPITLALPFRLGSVNCYLVKTDAGYILIDTGGSNKRAEIEEALHRAGCRPGDLNLIVLTHGDFDHTGNAAYLRQKFGAKLAMHPDDFGMLERGDMFWNRRKSSPVLKAIAPLLFRFGQSNRVTPDIAIDEGYDFSGYGLGARVLSIPGHSKGSIALLTADGDLFVGDLFENTKQPKLNSIMDDLAAAQASAEKLRSLEVRTVYPGHGRAFPLSAFFSSGS